MPSSALIASAGQEERLLGQGIQEGERLQEGTLDQAEASLECLENSKGPRERQELLEEGREVHQEVAGRGGHWEALGACR